MLYEPVWRCLCVGAGNYTPTDTKCRHEARMHKITTSKILHYGDEKQCNSKSI